MVVAFAFAAWRGIVASTLGDSPRKGRVLLEAHVLFGGAFLLVGSMLVLGRWVLPVSEANGHVVSVQVHSHSHSHPTDLQIETNSGEYLYLHASDRSDYFRAGERVHVRYQGYNSSLIEARFLTADGEEEGIFRDPAPFYSLLLIALGLFFIWGAYKKYHRDPEGRERPSGRLADTNIPTTLDLSKGASHPLGPGNVTKAR
jgi:hypothetical protein